MKMFEGAITVANQLNARISTLKNQRDTRKIGISALFEKFGTSLERLVKTIENGKPLKRNIRELEMSVKAVSGTVGDMIGFEKTDELTETLKQTFTQENFDKLTTLSKEEIAVHKKILKEAAGKYLDLWEAMEE
jgi:hypothetical protein